MFNPVYTLVTARWCGYRCPAALVFPLTNSTGTVYQLTNTTQSIALSVLPGYLPLMLCQWVISAPVGRSIVLMPYFISMQSIPVPHVSVSNWGQSTDSCISDVLEVFDGASSDVVLSLRSALKVCGCAVYTNTNSTGRIISPCQTGLRGLMFVGGNVNWTSKTNTIVMRFVTHPDNIWVIDQAKQFGGFEIRASLA